MKTILEKYNDAEKLLLKHTHNAVLNGKPKAVKLDDNTFYYAREYSYPETEYEYLKVDMNSGNKTPLFDHEKLRRALKEAGLKDRITFGSISYKDDICFKLDGKTYSYKDGKVSETENDVCKRIIC